MYFGTTHETYIIAGKTQNANTERQLEDSQRAKPQKSPRKQLQNTIESPRKPLNAPWKCVEGALHEADLVWMQPLRHTHTHIYICIHTHTYNRDGRPDCDLVDSWMQQLSQTHPKTKFTRIYFSNAIPKYPERNLPTVLVYRNHDIVWKMVTMMQLGMGAVESAEKAQVRASIMCVCVCVCVYLCICVSVHVCSWEWALWSWQRKPAYVFCVCVCVCVCARARVYLCIYVCICLDVHVCTMQEAMGAVDSAKACICLLSVFFCCIVQTEAIFRNIRMYIHLTFSSRSYSWRL
jgi:hypothetical protein